MIFACCEATRTVAMCPAANPESHSAANSTVISFGRHQGKRLGCLPESYLAWMVTNLQQAEWGNLAQQVLEQRKSSSRKSSPLETGFASRLKSVKSLQDGKSIHTQIIAAGKEGGTYLGNLLVEMYSSFGSVKDARFAFSRIRVKDVFSWNSMINGYVRNGQHRKAIKLYQRMSFDVSSQPNELTFAGILEACGALKLSAEGVAVHARIVASSLETVESLQKSLMSMYICCNSLEAARLVFDDQHSRDLVSWNLLIVAYAHMGYPEEAVVLFRRMEAEPDDVTLSSVLLAYSCLGDVAEAREIHARIESKKPGVIVENALLDMFTKCGSFDEAWELFGKMQTKDAVSWNVMISACVQENRQQAAIELYRNMDLEGIPQNLFTFSTVLAVFSKMKAVSQGKEIYERLVESELEPGLLDNAFLDMYDASAGT